MLIGYTLWTNFVILAVIQNSYTIVFYSISNLNLLFFFTPSIKIIQIATIFFFGFFFLIMIQVFPLVPYFQYFSGSKVKLILNDTKFISPGIVFGFVKFCCKIIIECAIHYYLFESPGKQKIMLCLINVLSVVFFIYFDYKYSLFGEKIIGWAGNIGEFIFALFNICLVLQYDCLDIN